MSRPSVVLRDAALGYASRGIPVLPLHYPLPHHLGVQPVTHDGRLAQDDALVFDVDERVRRAQINADVAR